MFLRYELNPLLIELLRHLQEILSYYSRACNPGTRGIRQLLEGKKTWIWNSVCEQNALRGVTTHVVRLKLFRLKAEGSRKARLPYFNGNIRFLHQRWIQDALFPNSLQPIHLSSYCAM
jgi:hypothetical protein